MKKFVGCFLLVLLLPALLVGCASSALRERSFFAMDTYFTLSACCDEDVLSDAEQEVRRLEKLLSVVDPDSPVSVLNQTGISQDNAELSSLVSQCDEISSLTGGLFDISVYPAVKAWGFTTDEYHVLTEEQSTSLCSFIGFEKIAVTGTTVTLPDGMQLDFGAVAKGYCSDKLVALLRSRGVESAVLGLGGNVYALGRKPDGKKWKVAINDPLKTGYVCLFEAENQAVVTSGNYERFFEKDGKKYGHIIDPTTARPAESDLLSVTVIGESGFLCDALSTALFVMGKEKAVAFLQTADVDAVLVTDNGSVLYTGNLSPTLSLQGSYIGKGEVIRW